MPRPMCANLICFVESYTPLQLVLFRNLCCNYTRYIHERILVMDTHNNIALNHLCMCTCLKRNCFEKTNDI